MLVIPCIYPSKHRAGTCLKIGTLKIPNCHLQRENCGQRWLTMCKHAINPALEVPHFQEPGLKHLGETKFSDRAEFSRTSSKALMWWMVDDGCCFLGSPQCCLDDAFWWIMAIRDGNLPVCLIGSCCSFSVLGVYLFLCSLAARFCFVWIMFTPPPVFYCYYCYCTAPATTTATTTPPPPSSSTFLCSDSYPHSYLLPQARSVLDR